MFQLNTISVSQNLAAFINYRMMILIGVYYHKRINISLLLPLPLPPSVSPSSAPLIPHMIPEMLYMSYPSASSPTVLYTVSSDTSPLPSSNSYHPSHLNPSKEKLSFLSVVESSSRKPNNH